jgi:spore coat protein CotF
MPFGAHETMEVHEILSEKINMISHFNFYATQTKNPMLKDMINRHQQEEIKTYDAMVAYTHEYTNFTPVPPNTNVSFVKPDQIQYGLDNPTMLTPETNASFNDYEVAAAMLHCHKNAAANGVKAALEIADPNLRQMILNGAVNCVNQAYEVFLFMNQQGLYQLPQLKDHTAKTFLHSYQPAGESIKAQYVVNPEQNQGKDQPLPTYMYGSLPMSQLGQMSASGQPLAHSGQMGMTGQMGSTAQNTVPLGHNMHSFGGMSVGGTMSQQNNMGSTGQPIPSFGQMGNPNIHSGNPASMQQNYQGSQLFKH